MVVGDGLGADDGADLGEEVVEVVWFLDGIDDAGFQHLGADRWLEIAARDDGAHAGPALFHFQKRFAAT